MIGIVDYGMGNLFSVSKSIKMLGYDVVLVKHPEDLHNCTKVILPGVGNFLKGMQELKKTGMDEAITSFCINEGRPLLGICLGMQLLTSYSEEGDCHGLNIVPAQTRRFVFRDYTNLRVPHMGWNTVSYKGSDQAMINITDSNSEYYFVHSYFVASNDRRDVLFTTEYGIEFDSAIQHNNVLGFQFHPEKSHSQGLSLLSYFCEMS